MKKLSINVESLHLLTFSIKRHECQIDKRDGHGNKEMVMESHRKFMEKYFVKSMGTLSVDYPYDYRSPECSTYQYVRPKQKK